MKRRLSFLILILSIVSTTYAHVGEHRSIHDITAGIITRIQEALPPDSLARLSVEDALRFVTDEDRQVLATEFWTFDVNVPATVTILRYTRQSHVPFWMEEAGFTRTEGTVTTGNGRTFEVWQKRVEAGHVGLGINGFEGNSRCYFVAVGPVNEGDSLVVTNIYPGGHTATQFQRGESIYSDAGHYRLDQYPEELEGHVMLRGIRRSSSDTRIVHLFRATRFPSSPDPDQVILTWGDDPKTTQAVQWRTNLEVSDGVVQYRRKDAGSDAPWSTMIAGVTRIRDAYLANDPVCNHYSVVIRGLEPGTTYVYRVGSPATNRWSAEAEFNTAPGETVPFTFIYMGDVQNGIDDWETMVTRTFREYPQTAFYLLAGDQVNRGTQRDDWDNLFNSARNVFNQRPFMPSVGNHECQGGRGPWMYLRLLTLPENGPMGLDVERAYSFRYSNALFVVLDSNEPPEMQSEWLEEQLANTDATWKFVAYHHPAYSSHPSRDNREIRQIWGDLFDRYHVDMALQGHDHAYLRTWPMRGGERAESAEQGTYYVVSSAGSKYYDQGERDYTAVGFTNTSMFQVLDIRIDGNRLTYRAYDNEGNLKDEIVIEK